MTGPVQLNGTTYQRLVEKGQKGNVQEYFFRKSGSDYFEYTAVDKYTAAVKFTPAVNAPLNFLKEKLTNDTIWRSGEYTSYDSLTGKPVTLRYVFQCVNADANLYVNGINYQHLYSIIMQAYTRPDGSADFKPSRDINSFYYAKGIGIIYMKKVNHFYDRIEVKLRNWKVN
jgi:hypothetical protein